MQQIPSTTVVAATTRTPRRTRRAVAGMAVLMLSLAACGGEKSASSTAAGQAKPGGVRSTTSAPPVERGKDDASSSASLHPLLAALPLPPAFEVPFPAEEYSADIDKRETVVQHLTVMMPVEEFARFWLTELPGAGFTIVDRGDPWVLTEADIVPGQEVWIYVETPDGFPAQLILAPQGERTGVNVNLYRAGDDG